MPDHPLKCEVSTTVPMLVSVFGPPYRADVETNTFEWRIVLDADRQASITNQATGSKGPKLQTWTVTANHAEALQAVQSALSTGENYYDGTLHPELFVLRK